MKKKGRSQITVSYIPSRAMQTSSLLDVKGNVKLSTPSETENSCCIYKERKTNNMQLFIAVVFILLFLLTINLVVSAKFILDCKALQISV